MALTSIQPRSPAATGYIQAVDEAALSRLREELAAATAELKAHMASWEYAFAMGASRHGGSEHPLHWQTRARTERLIARRRDLLARLSEHEA